MFPFPYYLDEMGTILDVSHKSCKYYRHEQILGMDFLVDTKKE